MEIARRRLGLILRAAVSLLLIAWLLHGIDWTQLWLVVRAMDPVWLLAAFLCSAPAVAIITWRWQLLLGVHGVRLRFWRIFELTMIGQFFSAFMIGSTGGDVAKIFYVARTVPQRKVAVSFTVLVDRVIGLVALVVFGAGLSFTQLERLFSRPGTKAATLTFYLMALGAVIVSLLACAGPVLMQQTSFRSWLEKLPFLHYGTPLFAAYEATARAVGVNLLAFLGSLVAHVWTSLRGYCIILAMHLQPTPSLLLFCAVLAIVNTILALPVSIAGLGVREALFVMFFALVAMDKEQAIGFSLTYFAVNLLWSLLGGVVYFLYRHEEHVPAPTVAEPNQIFPGS